MEQRILTISLEKAKELYKNGSEDMKSLLLESFSKEELDQATLPKTWEEYCENHRRKGYFLSIGSVIHSFDIQICDKLDPKIDKNTFESKENAEAILALCQLIRLRDEYNGHRPIVDEKNCTFYAIEYDAELNCYDIISINLICDYVCLFVFRSKELAEEFLKNFRPLLDKFYKIMY